jgi:hypothetical protein
VVEYRLEVREGTVRPPPVASEVPPWIAEVLLQGLSTEPADRHASMHALLDRLAEALADPVEVPAPRRRRPVLWFSAVVVLVGFAAALGFALRPPAVETQSVVGVDRKGPSTDPPGVAIPELKPLAAAESDAEAKPADPTPAPEDAEPAAESAAKRTTPKVGPRSRRPRGGVCYFDDRDKYFTQGRAGLKRLMRNGTCYRCRPAPPSKSLYPDVEGITCSRNYTCLPDLNTEACAKSGSGS